MLGSHISRSLVRCDTCEPVLPQPSHEPQVDMRTKLPGLLNYNYRCSLRSGTAKMRSTDTPSYGSGT